MIEPLDRSALVEARGVVAEIQAWLTRIQEQDTLGAVARAPMIRDQFLHWAAARNGAAVTLNGAAGRRFVPPEDVGEILQRVFSGLAVAAERMPVAPEDRPPS